ncbi:hypothetical protein ABT061_29165 [Streptosporangium sp. NPDC002544]|uniref:hypothetical protein n=1 Tax=Streptosporangium sp. NPDC002544 TaxID=3154538 RepID=UPI003321112D
MIRRLLVSAALVGSALIASTAVALPASATPSAYATIIGYYPSAESCNYFGQQGLGTAWPWYTCFQSGSVWALQVPW